MTTERPTSGGRSASSSGLDPSRRFDPLVAGFTQQRYELLAELRAQAPAVYLPALGMWAITRIDDVRAVLADPATFPSSGAFAAGHQLPSAAREHYDPAGPLVRYAHINNDEPLHRRLRGPLAVTFTPRRVREIEPGIRADTDQIVASMFDDGPVVDLVERLTRPLPVRTICRLLGLPVDDAPRFRPWSEAKLVLQLPGLPQREYVAAARHLAEFDDYIRGFVTGHTTPEPGRLIARLVEDRAEGRNDLTNDELTGSIASLFFAGHETTTSTMGNIVAHLLHQRSLWDGMVAGDLALDNVIEEALRVNTAVIGLYRRAAENVTIGDVTVPAGATLWVVYAAANRDPQAFPDPDEFDAERPNLRDHVSFGHGPHFCAGAALARTQLRTALTALSRLHPGLRLAQDVDERPHHTLRIPTAISVTR